MKPDPREIKIRDLSKKVESQSKALSRLQKEFNKLQAAGEKAEVKEYKNLVQFDENGYPKCEEHGALLCVNPDMTLWRCPECNVGIDVSDIYRFVEREVRRRRV